MENTTEKKSFTRGRVRSIEELINEHLCKFYNAKPVCQRCSTECPYDVTLRAMRNLRNTLETFK